MRAALGPTADNWMARHRPVIAELSARTLCAVFYFYFIYKIGLLFLESFSLTVTLLLIAESLTVLLVITARFPSRVNRSLYPSIITVAASFYFLLVELSDGVRLAPLYITASMQIAGIFWQVVSKIHLGRSFGLLPANRGIVTSGPYSIVRHPVYLGYFVSHMGFLLAVWSPYNLGVYTFLYTLQFLRIREEERLLAEDTEYQQYKHTVRRRFIPFLI